MTLLAIYIGGIITTALLIRRDWRIRGRAGIPGTRASLIVASVLWPVTVAVTAYGAWSKR